MRGPLTPLLLLLLPLLIGVAPSHAGEDDLARAREDARAELLAEAGTALLRNGDGAVAAMKRGMSADRAFVAEFHASSEAESAQLDGLRAAIADRVLLLGEPARGSGDAQVPATDGALQDAERLLAWLEGRLPCAVLVSDQEGSEQDARAYEYPPPVKPKPKPADEDAPEKAPDDAGPGREKPGAEPKAKKAPKAKAPPPTAAERLVAWAQTVRDAEGVKFAAARITPARCTVIPYLLEAAAAQSAYVAPGVEGLRRHSLVTEEAFAYNVPQATLCSAQAIVRGKAMQVDRAQPSLVDSSMVREKAAAVSVFREAGKRVRDLRRGVIAALDRMVEDLDGWKTQAALLAGEIGDRRAGLRGTDAPAKGQEDAELAKAALARELANLPLRLAQARETLTTIEIALLYQTAVRAKLRLELLQSLIKAADDDTHAAEVRHRSYTEALLTLRSTRRLDRLGRDRRALVRWSSPLRETTPVGGSPGALELAAYDALLEVNEAVQAAVRRRSEMAVGAVGPEPSDEDAPAGSEGEARAGPRLSKLVAEPQGATWDIKYLEIARRELLDDELRDLFDVTLVATHFAEASERVNALVAAERAAAGQEQLAARFDTSFSRAELSLEPLATDVRLVYVRELPAILAAAASDFEAAMSGIATQQTHNRERLRALLSYQDLLRSQGTRSLLIRIDRSQRDPYFGDVLSDTRGALESAGAWASFQGESHVGGFLARMWLRLLLLLALLIAVFFLARYVRRQVDRWISSTVASHPDVRASVRDERAQAKRRRARADRAAHEMTEDEVLRRVDLPDEDLEEGAPATPEERTPPRGGTS